MVPITANVARVYPFQVLLPSGLSGLDRDSKAQAEQVRAVAVERVGAQLGTAPANVMNDVEGALRLHLAL